MGKSSKRRGAAGGGGDKKRDVADDDDDDDEYDGVPVECTPSELSELREQASALTFDEARIELLDCARYGEVDAVRAILDAHSGTGSSGAGASSPPLVESVDRTGSTPLHRSSANGHLSTTLLLLRRGARRTASNDSGNSPLHWAASNGHSSVVKALLEEEEKEKEKEKEEEKVDVLKKNDFGRSALTEGFSSKDTEVVRLLLEHDSAAEERLLSGGTEVDPEEVEGGEGAEADGDVAVNDASSVDTAGTGSTSGACVVHEFDFLRGSDDDDDEDDEKTNGSKDDDEKKSVLIRELPITRADDPFGSDPSEDTTGLGIWCASLVMARWASSPSVVGRLRGRRVVELGAGCGVPGLAAAVALRGGDGAGGGGAESMTLTDLNPATVRNLEYNVALNDPDRRNQGGGTTEGTEPTTPWSRTVRASTIDWDDPSTYPHCADGGDDDNDDGSDARGGVDVVLGSDLVYQSAVVPYLLKAVSGLLPRPGGLFLYVAPLDAGRDGLDDFLRPGGALESAGFVRSGDRNDSETMGGRLAPDSYRSNPLRNGDEEECFLHFHELASTRYVLHEFVRK